MITAGLFWVMASSIPGEMAADSKVKVIVPFWKEGFFFSFSLSLWQIDHSRMEVVKAALWSLPD